jgi:hypothetical protein
VVSEAWIDDLNKWVVLDGQNGFYWVSANGTPLGLLELQQLHHDGIRAEVETVRRAFTDDELAIWWAHFHSGYVNDAAWTSGPVSPYFESNPARRPFLVAEPAHAYPDLTELGIAFAVADGRPAIQPHVAHPFATGYRVTDAKSTVDYLLTDPWVFPDVEPGTHEIQIATLTPYGATKPATLTWRTT